MNLFSKIKILVTLSIIAALSLSLLYILPDYIILKKDKYYKIKSYANKTSEDLSRYKDFLSFDRSRIKGILVADSDNQEIFIDLKDQIISGNLLRSGEWEPHIRNLLKKIVKPNDKALVIGAHVGTHAILISKLVGNEGKVFAFEPNPSALWFLKHNLYFSKSENITVYEKAAFNENKTISFTKVSDDVNPGSSHINLDNSNQNTGENIDVEAVTIDSIPEINNIQLILMDVEGAEPYAIKGAENLINNSPDLVVMQEWTPNWIVKEKAEYAKFWSDKGFKFAIIKQEQLVPLTQEELLKIENPVDIIIAKNLDEIISKF